MQCKAQKLPGEGEPSVDFLQTGGTTYTVVTTVYANDLATEINPLLSVASGGPVLPLDAMCVP
jgi:hypothetical protein